MVSLYDGEFFDFEQAMAQRAAQIILPDVILRAGARSVIDIGCGTGAWISIAKTLGAQILGVDGYVDSTKLLIDDDEFVPLDLIRGHFDCYGWDLALCLEVAEHLPEECSAKLVESLCSADFVLFSAAIPNQGGVGHINEQLLTWWETLFAAHGYKGTEDVRKRHWTDSRIPDFYRQNIILFSRPERLEHIGYEVSRLTDAVHPDLARAKGWLPA